MSADLGHRLKWAIGHFLFSAAVMVAIGLLIFLVWYPHPYRVLSGGLSLFLLVATVDVVLGPLCTFAVASGKKRLGELRMDVSLIALVQLAALAYGAWTVFQARPVYLAFEIDRLRVVHAIDVDAGLLAKSPPAFQQLPLFGPGLVAVRPFVSNAEKMEVTMAALQGLDIGARADLWVDWASQGDAIRAAAQPMAELLARKPDDRAAALAALADSGLSADTARYLPVAGRDTFWVAVLGGPQSEPQLFLPIDPY